MRFAEKKLDKGFKYWTVDNEVFGKMVFEAPVKLEGEKLDLLMSHCLNTQLKKGEVKIVITKKKIVLVKFNFQKKPIWGRKEKIKITLEKKS